MQKVKMALNGNISEAEIYVSAKTIEFHRYNIRKKLGIKNKPQNASVILQITPRFFPAISPQYFRFFLLN